MPAAPAKTAPALPRVDDYLTDGKRLVEVVEASSKQMVLRDVISEYLIDVEPSEFKLWREVRPDA